MKKCILDSSSLLGRHWSFGPLDGTPLTFRFSFGSDGRIQNYDHQNERFWTCKDGILQIFRGDGGCTWTSNEIYTFEDGAHINLRSNENTHSSFALRQRPIGRIAAARFLFPDELEVTPLGVKKILLIGSCLSQRYCATFRALREDIHFDHVFFNNVGDLHEPPLPVMEYDVQYIQIPLRTIITDRVIDARMLSKDSFIQQILEDGRMLLDNILESALAFNRTYGLPSLVSNFVAPQTGLTASMQQRGSRHDLRTLVHAFNDHLSTSIARYKNVFLCDVDALASSFGKRFFLDDVTSFSSHNSIFFQEEHDLRRGARIEPLQDMRAYYDVRWLDFFELVLEQMLHSFRTLRQIDQVKAVIFDLDNTIWRGQVAEDYREDTESRPPTSEWQIGIWDAIQHLRARGILVAIASKNDIDVVTEKWDSVVQPPFVKLQDFASKKINWKSKAENVVEICEEFNIKPKSVLFVDDNPVEREAVRLALPGIRTIGANPYVIRRILLWSAETQIPSLTNESQHRESAIRGQMARESSRLELTREEFFQTLQSTVDFVRVVDGTEPEASRILELTNKTNQFNTTGERWTSTDMTEFLSSGGLIIAFRVTDRFTEYGLVGAIYTIGSVIHQFVMSCRVMGLEIERAGIAKALEELRIHQGDVAVRARLRITDDNRPCHAVFSSIGFSEVPAIPNERIFELGPSKKVTIPTHISEARPFSVASRTRQSAKPRKQPEVSILVHIANLGDRLFDAGDWAGSETLNAWLEGFMITLSDTSCAENVEYQAIGKDGNQCYSTTANDYCGTRGRSVPIVKFGVRTKGKFSHAFHFEYYVRFTDASVKGPFRQGEIAQAVTSGVSINAIRFQLVPP